MTQINPFIGAIIQSTQVQRAQAAEKNAHVQRAQTRAKDSASSGDKFEHQVESTEALSPIRDEAQEHPEQRKPRQQGQNDASSPDDRDEGDDDAPAHIDVKV